MTSSSPEVVRITPEWQARTVLVRFAGDRVSLDDDSVALLREQLDDLAGEAGGRRLVLDFCNVGFISSTALGLLIRLHRQVQAAGGRLMLRNLSYAVYEVFEVTRLVTLLNIERPALAAPDGPEPPAAVLVVDDDDAIRRFLDFGLRREGFAVAVTATGREALELYRADQGAAAAVLLDVMLRGEGGPEVLAALRCVNPGVRCSFMTGDPGRYNEEDLLRFGARSVLWKPFTLGEAIETVRLLAAPSDAPLVASL
jgi:anti-anti-sigma factor